MRVKLFLIYATLWLTLIGVTFFEQISEVNKFAETIAFRQAEMFFQHIVTLWNWSSQHGGVYVPISSSMSPNPYLTLPNRDVSTSDGQQLTLVNPSCMARELAEIEFRQTGINFHITSLKPARPENKPDKWEAAALGGFLRGESTKQALTDVDGQPVYRYMAPVRVQESCLKCHNAPGTSVGQINGGVSISIPVSSIESFISNRVKNLQVIHGVIGVVGLVALLFSYLAQSRLSRRLVKTKNHLQLAYLDSLTLLPNRRYYDAFVKREWKRASRHGYPLSMIMIDIDYFKAYNDSLGHLEGDHCLRQVARTLRKYFRRPSDLIARYGGEEFCVVAACDEVQIAQLADILRMAVETMQLPHPKSVISKYVTVSLGVATLVPNESSEYDQLLHNADQALYMAKQQGRNRVEKFESIQSDEDYILPP
jgi:diguanylate cyclase (GGDEF)-like protein